MGSSSLISPILSPTTFSRNCHWVQVLKMVGATKVLITYQRIFRVSKARHITRTIAHLISNIIAIVIAVAIAIFVAIAITTTRARVSASLLLLQTTGSPNRAYRSSPSSSLLDSPLDKLKSLSKMVSSASSTVNLCINVEQVTKVKYIKRFSLAMLTFGFQAKQGMNFNEYYY